MKTLVMIALLTIVYVMSGQAQIHPLNGVSNRPCSTVVNNYYNNSLEQPAAYYNTYPIQTYLRPYQRVPVRRVYPAGYLNGYWNTEAEIIRGYWSPRNYYRPLWGYGPFGTFQRPALLNISIGP